MAPVTHCAALWHPACGAAALLVQASRLVLVARGVLLVLVAKLERQLVPGAPKKAMQSALRLPVLGLRTAL